MRLDVTMVAVALLGAACGGGGGDSGPPPEPARLAFTVQPAASTVGQPIAPPVQVSVQDESGSLVGGAVNAVTLTIQATPAGPTLGGTTTVNAVGGVATFSDLQVGTRGTGLSLQASATGLAGATSATFDVLPAHGVAAQIGPADGDDQTAEVGHAVATNPSVRVTDGYGDPVAGVDVTFSVSSGEGTVDGLVHTTDAGGLATAGGWTLGTLAGPNTLVATTSTGLEATFTATGKAGPAASLILNDGDDQIAGIDGAVTEPPSVLATDVYGNPVGGVAVTFAVKSGGGSVTGASQTTGEDGVATVGAWTLGSTLGANTLEARSPGLTA